MDYERFNNITSYVTYVTRMNYIHGGNWELEQQSQQKPGGGELQHMHWGHIGGSAHTKTKPLYYISIYFQSYILFINSFYTKILLTYFGQTSCMGGSN